jgi:dipeptidyl aminopeptidase/acylaminoacyl peptidase
VEQRDEQLRTELLEHLNRKSPPHRRAFSFCTEGGDMIARYVFAFVSALACTYCCADARTVTENDYRRLVSLSSAAISPDGRFAAVVASRVDWDEDRRIRELLLVDVGTRTSRSVLIGRKGLDAPTFSPDGKLLAFLANDSKSHAQIYVMNADGARVRQVTHGQSDVDGYAWRPDSAGFAYTATDAEPKRRGADRFRDSFVFTTEPITARSHPRPDHVFVQSLTAANPVQLTFGRQNSVAPLSWSPDGRHIAFVLTPNAITNDESFSRAAVVDVRSKRIRAITGRRMWEGTPLFSPDGTRIAYTYSDGDPQVRITQLYVTGANGGGGVVISSAIDRTIGDAVWMAGGTSLIVTVPDKTTNAFYRLTLGGRAPVRLNVGDVTPGVPLITTGGASASLQNAVSRNGSIAFIGTSTSQPPELFVRLGNGVTQQLTHVNSAFARSIQWGAAERITFPTSLGITADGVLYKPPHFMTGRKYPLVVYIHGGPTDPSLRIFDFWAQVMAARGWLVLRPNYRGSPNLGSAYQHAVLYDPEDGPGKDIMSALSTVRARGIVDDRRIAVSGWSYGGIMTAWLISKYHVWAAAVSGASVNDWITDYGTADDSLADRDLLHGSPFVGNNAAEWRAVSAISYAKDVTTPVLILSDIGDNRDPFATSSMYWRALRDNHKDATLRTWPVDGHFPSDPVRTVDVFHYWIDYIARHF